MKPSSINGYAIAEAIGSALQQAFDRQSEEARQQESYTVEQREREERQRRELAAVERIGHELSQLNQVLHAFRLEGLRLNK